MINMILRDSEGKLHHPARALRFLVAWLLFGLGHLLSLPMSRWDWGFLYSPYNWLMLTSSDIQGPGGGRLWPWGVVSKSQSKRLAAQKKGL